MFADYPWNNAGVDTMMETPLHGKRILVTGASGALGRHLVGDLLRGGCRAQDIASFSSAPRGHGEIAHIASSFLDSPKLLECIDAFDPHIVFHLAWETRHGSYWHADSNVAWADSSIRLADHLARAKDRQMVFAGTCAEYRWAREILREDDGSDIPETLYGRQKKRVSEHLDWLARKGDLGGCSGRVFFPYSAIENLNRITTVVVRNALVGKTTHLRSGDVYREIFHTRHVAAAFVKLAVAKATGVYNIARSLPVHLGKFLSRLAEIAGGQDLVSWDTFDPATADEPHRLLGSRNRIQPYLEVPADQTADMEAFVAEIRKS